MGQDNGVGRIPRRLMPVFRDRAELPVSADLGANIREALRDSAFLIVICSPHSSRSRWVDAEIRTFKALGREDRILCLIVDGEPNVSDKPRESVHSQECFAESLRYRVDENGALTEDRVEPIAADTRRGGDSWRAIKLKLVAGLLGVTFDELFEREKRRTRAKWGLWAVGAVATFLIAFFVYERSARRDALSEAKWTRRDRRQEYVSAITGSSEKVALRDFEHARRLLWSTQEDQRGWDWGYGLRQAYPALVTLRGHGKPIVHGAYSKNGQHMLTASSDGVVTVYDAASAAELATLKAGDGGYLAAAFFSEAPLLLVVSASGNVEVRDLDAGRLQRRFSCGSSACIKAFLDATGRIAGVILEGSNVVVVDAKGDAGPVTLDDCAPGVLHMAFSPNLALVATTHEDNSTRIWNTTTGALLTTVKGHTVRKERVAYITEGNRATAPEKRTTDNDEIQAAISRGASVRSEHVEESGILYAVFHPKRDQIVTSGADGTVRIWDVTSGVELAVLKGHQARISYLAFSQDGLLLATVSDDKTVRLWDSQTWHEIAVLEGHDALVVTAEFRSDGRRIITASADGTARIWSVDGDFSPIVLGGHSGPLTSARFSPDGITALTASVDGTAKIWNAAEEKQCVISTIRGADLHSAEFSPDGTRILVGYSEPEAKLCDSQTGEQTTVIRGLSAELRLARFSPTGECVAIATEDNAITIWNVGTAHRQCGMFGHDKEIRDLEYSPNGSLLVTASGDRTAKVWNASSGVLVRTLSGHTEEVVTAKFSPDGKRIVTASKDGTVRLWDVSGDGSMQTSNDTKEPLASAYFARCGDSIVTTSQSGTVTIWEGNRGRRRHVLAGKWAPSLPTATSKNTPQLVTFGRDGDADVWNLSSGDRVTPLKGHSEDVVSATYSPDGRLIATGDDAGNCMVWDAMTGTKLASLSGHESDVEVVRFSSDGLLLLTACDFHHAVVRIWRSAPFDDKDLPDDSPQSWRTRFATWQLQHYRWWLDRERNRRGGPTIPLSSLPLDAPATTVEAIRSLFALDPSERAKAAFELAPSMFSPTSQERAITAMPFLVSMLDDRAEASTETFGPPPPRKTTPSHYACFALTQIGLPAINPLLKKLAICSPATRQEIIFAMDKILSLHCGLPGGKGGPTNTNLALDGLILALTDDGPDTRRNAARLLQTLTDQNFGQDHEGWVRWYRHHKARKVAE